MERIERVPTKIPLPEAYKLAATNAPVELLARQLYEDSHSTRNAGEKIYLGIQSLISRGEEGLGALALISKGNDELARVAKMVIERPEISAEELESTLGINRKGNVFSVDPRDRANQLRLLPTIYEYAKGRGYTNLTYNDFERKVYEHVVHESDEIPQLEGTLDNYLIPNAATFGTSEATYLELVGPLEILRLRSLSAPQLLLLGSLGKYSSREFAQYARKINPHALTHTIELGTEATEIIRKDNTYPDHFLVQGDARRLPYAEASMDHIYSNHLFHSLRERYTREPGAIQDIGHVIGEVSRVLKLGGSFVFDEQRFGRYAFTEEHTYAEEILDDMRREVQEVCEWSGLEKVADLGDSYDFTVSPDRGSSRIDENGFPQYGNTLLVRGLTGGINGRYIKK